MCTVLAPEELLPFASRQGNAITAGPLYVLWSGARGRTPHSNRLP